MSDAEIGVIGLAVMGSNLARNLESKGFKVAVYNRTTQVTNDFLKDYSSGNFVAGASLEEFLSSLASPKKIILMVKAGKPVDLVLDQMLPHLSAGDIVADGGNAYFRDTQRREKLCRDKGIHFLGVGISGGEEGALNGPSIMPGGPKEAWQQIAPMLERIAAQVDGPCTAYMGPDGAGHFVKMVHNGIEYGDMQIIAEVYHLLREVGGFEPRQISELFARWNEGRLSSYLMEISSSILLRKDDLGDGYLIDSILDKAGQKGTGRWTVQLALEMGVSVPTLAAAVDARVLSSLKDFRQKAQDQFEHVDATVEAPPNFTELLENALYLGKVLCYAQGMDLLRKASLEEGWELRLDEVAKIWRGGCIIRARFLDTIQNAFERNPSLENLVVDAELKNDIEQTLPALRQVGALACKQGLPIPALTSSLSYIESLRRAELPQNLTQAQRDYFGAHTYQRRDREGVFHSEWESLPIVGV